MKISWFSTARIPPLTSARLRLRGLRPKDYDAWMHLRWANAQWLKPWDPTDPTGNAPEISFRQMLSTQNRAAATGSAYNWAVTIPLPGKRADRIIGQVSLSGIQYGAARTASIGYWIDYGHAGRGFTPEAVAAVCHFAYHTLNLHRIEINLRPENQASLRVVEKLGFRDEGMRLRYLHIDGAWRDHRTFALNREDFGRSIFEHMNEQ